MPSAHAQPTTRAATAVADNVDVHVNGFRVCCRLRYHFCGSRIFCFTLSHYTVGLFHASTTSGLARAVRLVPGIPIFYVNVYLMAGRIRVRPKRSIRRFHPQDRPAHACRGLIADAGKNAC